MVVRTFVDYDGTYYNPVSQLITVYDSTNTVVYTSTTPINDKVGVFHYIVIVPLIGPAGSWSVVWSGLHGTIPTNLKITNGIENI